MLIYLSLDNHNGFYFFCDPKLHIQTALFKFPGKHDTTILPSKYYPFWKYLDEGTMVCLLWEFCRKLSLWWDHDTVKLLIMLLFYANKTQKHCSFWETWQACKQQLDQHHWTPLITTWVQCVSQNYDAIFHKYETQDRQIAHYKCTIIYNFKMLVMYCTRFCKISNSTWCKQILSTLTVAYLQHICK